MSNSKPNDNKDGNREIPDSSTKKARGSKSVHSPLDDSQEDGWKPDAIDKGKSEKDND
ncbi:MAG: hypothetical protein HKN40_10635 [Winogradskyella sp.]|uniref:hypothetical protein n=1 Tax=Winogradskyella sp. TaxID=1883156 RepID=UPI001799FCC5|nr:hypothetical protein [Winogradskyella sp.]